MACVSSTPYLALTTWQNKLVRVFHFTSISFSFDMSCHDISNSNAQDSVSFSRMKNEDARSIIHSNPGSYLMGFLSIFKHEKLNENSILGSASAEWAKTLPVQQVSEDTHGRTHTLLMWATDQQRHLHSLPVWKPFLPWVSGPWPGLIETLHML